MSRTFLIFLLAFPLTGLSFSSMLQETKIFKAGEKEIHVDIVSKPGNKTAVLMIHGFTSHIRISCFQNAAHTWPESAIDVWRISLYPGLPNTRTMEDSSWADSIADCNRVLMEMSGKYDDLYVIGHSLGGTNAMYCSHPRLKGRILWDPACNETSEGAAAVSIHPDYYTLYWDHPVHIPKQYVHDAIGASYYPEPLPAALPLIVFRSSESARAWPTERFPAEVINVPNSDHFFSRLGNEAILFPRTLEFISQNLSTHAKDTSLEGLRR